MKILIAKNKLGVIGNENTLPWHCKQDLQHFKKLTKGKKLLVGRVTYENMPELKNRTMIVVGAGYNTLQEGLDQKPDYIIGGKKLVEHLWNTHKDLITGVELSIIDDYTDGDCELDIDFYEDCKKHNIELNHYYFNLD